MIQSLSASFPFDSVYEVVKPFTQSQSKIETCFVFTTSYTLLRYICQHISNMSVLSLPIEVFSTILLPLDYNSLVNLTSCSHQIKNRFPDQKLWKDKLILDNPMWDACLNPDKTTDWLIEYRKHIAIIKIKGFFSQVGLLSNPAQRAKIYFNLLKYITLSVNGSLIFQSNISFRNAALQKFLEQEESLRKYGYSIPKKSKEMLVACSGQ